MLITDTRILDNLQILSESKSDGTMKIRGLFQESDTPNQNKRIYPRKIMETAVTNLQEMISDNRLCGELDHPSYEIVKLQNASHRITKLECKGKNVIGEAIILPTPAGQVAQALIKGGVKLGISSRGVGSVSEGKDGISEVNDDYKMITFDLVADPSVKGAFPGLMEGKESQDNSKLVEDTMKKVHGESIFIQMLENRLSKDEDEFARNIVKARAEEGDDKKTAGTKAKMAADVKAGKRSRSGRILDKPGPSRASKAGQAAERKKRAGMEVEVPTKMDRIRAAFAARQAQNSSVEIIGSKIEEKVFEAKSAKFERCVHNVKKKGEGVNPWAVCNASIKEDAREALRRLFGVADPRRKSGKIAPGAPKGMTVGQEQMGKEEAQRKRTKRALSQAAAREKPPAIQNPYNPRSPKHPRNLQNASRIQKFIGMRLSEIQGRIGDDTPVLHKLATPVQLDTPGIIGKGSKRKKFRAGGRKLITKKISPGARQSRKIGRRIGQKKIFREVPDTDPQDKL